MKYTHKFIIFTTALLTLPLAHAMDHPISAFVSASTTNQSLVDNKAIKLGETVGIQQSISKHVYYALSTTIPQNSAYTLEADLGLQTTYGRFMPHIELEGTSQHSAHKHNKYQLDYDFGTLYQLTNKIYPLVGFDGLGLRGNDAVKYGAMFKLTKKFSLSVEGIKFLRHTGSAAKVEMGMTLWW